MVECGWSDSLSRLRVDAERWLVHSRGDVQIVILVGVHQSEPNIVLETWAVDPNPQILRQGPVLRSSVVSTMCLQEVVFSRNKQGVIQTVGAPLKIDLKKVFLRDIKTAAERGISVSRQQLEFIAQVTWQEAGI